MFICYRVISKGTVLQLKTSAAVQVVTMPRGAIPAPLEFHHSIIRCFPQSLFPTCYLPLLTSPNEIYLHTLKIRINVNV